MSHPNSKGFTLLEIIIALFIFTIVSLIMTHALHTIFNIQAKTETHIERLSKLQFAALLFSRDFEQIINRPIINLEKKEEAALLGTSHNITFTHGGLTNPMNQLPRSTLQRTRYRLEKNILIRETWLTLDQVATSKPSPRSLLPSVIGLHFDYIDQQGHNYDKWPPPSQKSTILPRAIRLTMKLDQWGTFTQLYLIPGQTFEKKLS